MSKYKALIIGAGRIGAGYKWDDDAYTHAGAYKALSDRVELVGFVEPDNERRECAMEKWGVHGYKYATDVFGVIETDIVSICTTQEMQMHLLDYCCEQIEGFNGVWCEKPYILSKTDWPFPVQVNYMRRADPRHREIAENEDGGVLHVMGKFDLTTWCHFADLAKWWRCCEVQWTPVTGGCSYRYESEYGGGGVFPNGGVNGGECFRLMLSNLLDVMDGKPGVELFSPPYQL
jgi:predicted dehydrogenase